MRFQFNQYVIVNYVSFARLVDLSTKFENSRLTTEDQSGGDFNVVVDWQDVRLTVAPFLLDVWKAGRAPSLFPSQISGLVRILSLYRAASTNP